MNNEVQLSVFFDIAFQPSHTRMHTCTHARTRTHTHARTHTRTHARTHTHTHVWDFMFFKEVSPAHQSCIYSIKNVGKKQKYCEILLKFIILVSYFNIFKNRIYLCHHYSSLQCHMIFRNHNNMLIYYHC